MLLSAWALGANNDTRKMPKYDASNIKSMTAPGKLIPDTRELEAHLIRKSHTKLRFSIANVGMMIGRSADVAETFERRQLDVVAIQ